MADLTAQDIFDLSIQRERQFTTDRTRWNIMSNIYRGQHRAIYPEEFREGEVAKIAGFIKRSWDMFTRLVGKVPDVRSTPLRLTQKERTRAEMIEKICFGYNQDWKMRRRMKVWAHYQVGYGAVAVGVVPNEQTKSPMFLVEDPRNALPGPGWDATSVVGVDSFRTPKFQDALANGDIGSGLDDIIIRKVMTGHQLLKRFPNNAELRKALGDASSTRQLSYGWTVLQYYDETNITSVLENGILLHAPTPHGAPWCPWKFLTSFTPDQPAGQGMFEQQVGLEIAFMRILDQKLSLNDLVTWPWMKEKGFVEFDPVKRRIMLGSPDADAGFVTPPATFQVDRDLQQVGELLRTLNVQTEASQGEVQGGPITGRGLSELSKVVTETVQDFFDDNANVLPFIYSTALQMDNALWPNTTKTLAGRGRGETFLEEYTPGKDIGKGFGQITVEFGPGLGGFEGHLQMLQDLGADSISKDTIMEKNPNIPSVSEEKRKILRAKIEDLMFNEALQGQAAVPLNWLAALAQEIEAGRDYRQWIVDNPPGQATNTPTNVGPVPPAALGPQEQGTEGLTPAKAWGQSPRPTASPSSPAPPPALAALLGGAA